eukprot:TRINITY_DN1556_c0_g1_i1.p3 TRINITY_DN1556_c0_g1~~TRINITY_DN1556_c0_g1_i1.p3  ORF type:complete len:256 (+),score=29.41 TRINITY_DN1556_c0_g1_i1:98-769(+)
MSEIEYVLSKFWQEYRLLEQFMYKNKNQQRHFAHFKGLQKVLKELRFLHKIQTFVQEGSLAQENLELLSENLIQILDNLQANIVKAGQELWKVIHMQILLGFAVCAFCVLSRIMYLTQAIEHLQNVQGGGMHVFIRWAINRKVKPIKEKPKEVIQISKKEEIKVDKGKLVKVQKKVDSNSKISKKVMEKSKYLKDVLGILSQIDAGAVSQKRKKKQLTLELIV